MIPLPETFPAPPLADDGGALRAGSARSRVMVATSRREAKGHRAVLMRITGGFVLLEILMAIALFSTVSVAMVQALGQIADTSMVTRREALMVRRLESAITEASHRPAMEVGRWETGRDDFGINVRTTVGEADIRNREGKTLDGIWQVTVEVNWTDGVREETRISETYVNEKLSNKAEAEQR